VTASDLFSRKIEHMAEQPAHGRSQNMHDAQGLGASVAIVEAVFRHFRGALFSFGGRGATAWRILARGRNRHAREKLIFEGVNFR
jgi:hypothetical protein